MVQKEIYSLLPKGFSGGPHGLGDPEDKTLRKVEKDVLIPQIIRERSRKEKCVEEVKSFCDCAAKAGLLVTLKCKKENAEQLRCLKKWFYNDKFVQECTQQYLDERSEYRRTGVPKAVREAQREKRINEKNHKNTNS